MRTETEQNWDHKSRTHFSLDNFMFQMQEKALILPSCASQYVGSIFFLLVCVFYEIKQRVQSTWGPVHPGYKSVVFTLVHIHELPLRPRYKVSEFIQWWHTSDCQWFVQSSLSWWSCVGVSGHWNVRQQATSCRKRGFVIVWLLI